MPFFSGQWLIRENAVKIGVKLKKILKMNRNHRSVLLSTMKTNHFIITLAMKI